MIVSIMRAQSQLINQFGAMPKIVQIFEAEARPNKGKKRAGVTGCHRIAGLSARLGDEGETAIKNREPNVDLVQSGHRRAPLMSAKCQ